MLVANEHGILALPIDESASPPFFVYFIVILFAQSSFAARAVLAFFGVLVFFKVLV